MALNDWQKNHGKYLNLLNNCNFIPYPIIAKLSICARIIVYTKKAGELMYPEFLYHYTSVDTLELILRNKTIRFNPLNKMDDPLEQWSAHGVQEGKHVFVSSWTDQRSEIPDMWKQYCRPGPESGVRIKLPANPFSIEKNALPYGIKECVQKQIALVDSFVFWALGKHTVGDLDEDKKLLQEALSKYPDQKEKLSATIDGFTRETVECYTRSVDSLLHQVTYTNDPNKLFPWLYFDYKGQHFEVHKDFGKYKDTSWAWQYEWRYLLHFRMTTPGIRHADGSIDLYALPFTYYDLILDDDKLKQMEITLSPVITKRARKKVEDLVNRYNSTATIHTSELNTLG